MSKFNHARQNELNGIQHVVGTACQSLPGPYSFVLPGSTSDASQEEKGRKRLFLSSTITAFFRSFSHSAFISSAKSPIRFLKEVFQPVGNCEHLSFSFFNEPNFSSSSFRFHRSGKELNYGEKQDGSFEEDKKQISSQQGMYILNI